MSCHIMPCVIFWYQKKSTMMLFLEVPQPANLFAKYPTYQNTGNLDAS